MDPTITSNNPITLPTGKDGVKTSLTFAETARSFNLTTQHYKQDSNNITTVIGEPATNKYTSTQDVDCTTLYNAILDGLNTFKQADNAGSTSQLRVQAFRTSAGSIDANIDINYTITNVSHVEEDHDNTPSMFTRIARGIDTQGNVISGASPRDIQFAQLATTVMTAIKVFIGIKGL